MKSFLTALVLSIFGQIVSAQDTVKVVTKQEPIKKTDNYTVQYLIILNEKGEVLLQRNKAGWHTLGIRSNENQSVKEALDSLANSIGLTIHIVKLAGLYTYKFEGLPDHREVSFRTHFTARLQSGKLIQPKDIDREYRWTPIKEAMEKITFESLRLETSQILKNPKTIWGGSFLIIWKHDKFIGSRVLEKPYSLSN